MKSKILNLLLILTSLAGYLEWGKDNALFLFQAEMEVIVKLVADPASAAHPFTVLPMVGQLILLITLFQRSPGKWLTFIGMAGLGLLLGFMFIVGLMGLNYKIMLSTLPFLITSFLTLQHHRRS